MRQADGRRCSNKRIILLIITGLVLVLIFAQSVLPQSISGKESGWLTDKVINPLLAMFGLRPLTHNTVRKLAHITEFMILSILLALCLRGRIVKSVGIGFTAAFLDESIQLLSDRGASITDVWIDLIGVALGSLIGFLIVFASIHRDKRS